LVESEFVFQIGGVALADGSSPAPYFDKTVQVAPGSNAPMQSDTGSILTRRVPARLGR